MALATPPPEAPRVPVPGPGGLGGGRTGGFWIPPTLLSSVVPRLLSFPRKNLLGDKGSAELESGEGEAEGEEEGEGEEAAKGEGAGEEGEAAVGAEGEEVKGGS
eukprot:TRINITY_DN2216_c0_g1_i1.p2 TRINITY_DN2216_c0_g1~~TRINITY_DN2216_c0_g1_i1.p2  ORF type:complete len:104 (+),score=44.66 TRINITY_DN2216_c0_g1_i1:241-552(+)